MCPTTPPPGRHWDGSPTTRPRRALRLAPAGASRLLRRGQSDHCRACGNRIEWYYRSDLRPVPLHPHEAPTAAVPAHCRWHVSSGIAHPAGDGTPWCRLAHALLCPARTTPPLSATTPHLAALRRRLALHTRRLLDTGTLSPPATPPIEETATPSSAGCRPARPVVQLLYTRYLAARPVEEVQCLAQTRRRHRCTNPLLTPGTPAGTWTLMPATAAHGQLALPAATMAIYDLGHLPYTEQLRWRAQHCTSHAVSSAADLAVADWEPFDPLAHHEHIHPRLPTHTRRPKPTGTTRTAARP